MTGRTGALTRDSEYPEFHAPVLLQVKMYINGSVSVFLRTSQESPADANEPVLCRRESALETRSH